MMKIKCVRQIACIRFVLLIRFVSNQISMRKHLHREFLHQLFFALSMSLIAINTSAQCADGEIAVTIDIAVDAWGQETYWELVPVDSGCGVATIAFGSNEAVGCDGTPPVGDGGYTDNTMVEEGPFCLIEGVVYDLIFVDSYGDGGLDFTVYEDGSFSHFYDGTGDGNTWTFTAGDNGLPANDSPCGAFEVLTDGTELMLTNIGSIAQPGEPAPDDGSCAIYGLWCENNLSNTVWAYFTADADITYEITTCNSEPGFDTQLALYRATDCSDFSTFELISSNDDMFGGCSTANGFSSRMFASCLEQDAVYYIQLDGWNASTGEAGLTVTAYEGPNDLAAQVNNVTCPVEKGDEPNGALIPYMSGSGSDFTAVWTGPDGFESNENFVYGVGSGSYHVVVTTSCSEIFEDDFVIVEPSMWQVGASITNPDCTVSGDGAIDLNVIGATPPFTYAWVGPDNFQSEAEALTDLNPGTYDAVVTDENGCTHTLSYNLQPENDFEFDLGSDTVICIYNDVVVFGPAGYDYSWQDGSNNQFFEVVGEEWGLGSHAIILTATTDEGCTYTDAFVFEVDACVGIEDAGNNEQLHIYPNPVVDKVNVVFNRSVNNAKIDIYDASGKIVSSYRGLNGKRVIVSPDLASGVYTIKVQADGVVWTEKLVK